MTREPIYAALFASLASLTSLAAPNTVVTLSRKLQHWSDVEPSLQPAVFMAQGKEDVPKRLRGTPGRYTFNVTLYVYVNTAGTGVVPATVLNPILDAIQACLEPVLGGQPNTLGGLVYSCWIQGEIMTYEGTLGDQEVASIPIVIEVPA
jgi:hypothetical protein